MAYNAQIKYCPCLPEAQDNAEDVVPLKGQLRGVKFGPLCSYFDNSLPCFVEDINCNKLDTASITLIQGKACCAHAQYYAPTLFNDLLGFKYSAYSMDVSSGVYSWMPRSIWPPLIFSIK